MLEGALIWDKTHEERPDGNKLKWFIGEDIYTVFDRLTGQSPTGDRPEWLQPIEEVLEGTLSGDLVEHSLGQ